MHEVYPGSEKVTHIGYIGIFDVNGYAHSSAANLEIKLSVISRKISVCGPLQLRLSQPWGIKLRLPFIFTAVRSQALGSVGGCRGAGN